jgi:hypothetical protein
VQALQYRHLFAAETAESLRHLDPYRAAAQYDEPSREFLGSGDVAIGPRPRFGQTVDWWQCSAGPGRQDDGLRGPEPARLLAFPLDDDSSLAVEPPASAYQSDLVLVEPGQLAFVMPVTRHVVTLRQGGVDIDPGR